MIDFKGCKKLFNFLKMLNNLQKHWINTTSWSMAEAMHEIVFQAICLTMHKVRFIFMFYDEVTTINNQLCSFLSMCTL
jgi:hypothetical protein